MSNLLQFPLVSGIQEGVDPKTAPAGTVERLVNVAWTKDGRLDKRDGTKLVGLTGAPASALRLFSRDGELCICDGVFVYSWNPKLGSWVNRGAVPELAVETKPLTATVTGAGASDIVRLADGRIVHAWVSGDPTGSTLGSVFYEILDPDTGARTSQQIVVNAQGSSIGIRCITDGANWAIVYYNSSSLGIAAIVNGAGPVNLNSTGDVAVGGATPFDACNTGNGFVIAYMKAAGGIELRRYSYALGAPAFSVAVPTEVSTDYIAISIDGATGEDLYVAYARSANAGPLRLAIHNADTLASVVAPTGIDSTANALFRRVAVAREDASHARLAYSAIGQAGSTYVDGILKSMRVDNTATVDVTTIRESYGCSLLSRPFAMRGTFYMVVSDVTGSSSLFHNYGTTGFPLYPGTGTYIVECDTTAITGSGRFPNRYVGTVALLAGGTWRAGHVSNVVAVSATKVLTPVPMQEAASGTVTGWQQGVTLATITTGADMPADAFASAEIGGEAYLAGAFLTAYDGRRPFDFGFPRGSYIDNIGSVMNGGASGSLAAGDYYYSLVPVFRSAAGIMHRGPSAPIIKFTAAANDKMTLKWLPQTLAHKDVITDPIGADNDALRVVNLIYRGTVGSGTPQKRSVEPIVPGVNTEINVTGTAPQTFNDSVADGTLNLAAQPALYSVGELDDYPPSGPVVSLHLHRRRLFALLGDRRTIAYSKDYAENVGVAPGFNASAILVGFDEDLVGMATLDDKFVAGSEEAFYLFFGDGPNIDGVGGYDPPTKIATDVGFSNPRAIVATPSGVMFQSSPSKIHLLTRKLEVSWIGKPVQDTLAAFPNITSAVLVSAKNQVRFTCNAADGSSGVVLVFDYVRGAWTVFQYTDTNGVVASTPIADACMWSGAWTFVTPTGIVYQEDATTALDGGSTWVESDVELAENFATGPLGYQRVRRIGLLGDRVSDCNVRVRVATNGRATYDQDHTFTSDVIATEGVNLTRVVKVQKNGSIRMRFTDASPTVAVGSAYVPVVAPGRGVTLSAVGFEIEPIDGMKRRPAKAVA